MEEINRILGDSIKQARERLNKTQSQVSDESGVNNQTILKIENYKGNPNFDTLFPLIRALNIDPREIFYPEFQKDFPELRQLRMLIESCDKEEATALLSVVQSVLTVLRSKRLVPTK